MDGSNPVSGPKNITPTPAAETPATPEQVRPGSVFSGQLGQQEFLTLLVNQLQNQDPLNPMNSEEFAVQLAQFSQLEQLISINQKLEGGGLAGGSSALSMASFLGQEVVIGSGQLSVTSGRGQNVLVEIPSGTQSLRVDLLDAEGRVVGAHTVQEVEDGRQVIPLDGLTVPDGSYGVRVVSVGASGQFVELPAKVTGTVDGFIVGPEPRLLVGGKEVALEEITEVYRGASSAPK